MFTCSTVYHLYHCTTFCVTVSFRLVLTKLDFENATLSGIPSVLIDRLQAVMKAAARLVFQSSRYDHVTPLLHRLHWLRARERISYKLAVLVF